VVMRSFQVSTRASIADASSTSDVSAEVMSLALI
jgi:hypothetical protein